MNFLKALGLSYIFSTERQLCDLFVADGLK